MSCSKPIDLVTPTQATTSDPTHDHDISSPDSDVEFAPLSESEDSSGVDSVASMSIVEAGHHYHTHGRRIRPKHRPPPLHHQRSFSVEPRMHQVYTAGRESFIDLDDIMSPGPRSDSPDIMSPNPNAMYPTPTRARFKQGKRSSRNESLRSTASQLPTFARPGRDSAAYQPLTETKPRGADKGKGPAIGSGISRPQSILTTHGVPLVTFFDDEEPMKKSKPPIPRAPKPAVLLRKAAASSTPSSPKDQSPPKSRSRTHSPTTSTSGAGLSMPPPPTTNTRDPQERADLLRKHRKLTQVFGEGILWQIDDPHGPSLRNNTVAVPLSKHTNRLPHSAVEPSAVSERELEQVIIIGPKRRHSTPASPDFDLGGQMVVVPPSKSKHQQLPRGLVAASGDMDSPMSFMEFDNDHETSPPPNPIQSTTDDAASTLSLPLSAASSQMTPDPDRKKMRDKLTKLHRFLGSRVPIELALGAEYVLDDERDLPPVVVLADGSSFGESLTKEGGAKWLQRRRSSSSAALPGYEKDTPRPSMDDRERALNVKRANKMEQMFGTRPPATLYQTRLASATPPPSTSADRNSNTGAYQDKGRYSGKRPSTSESIQPLLHPYVRASFDEETERERSPFAYGGLVLEGSAGVSTTLDAAPAVKGKGKGQLSAAYMHWRHSLHSLTDIIDKDDKASLAELHQLMNASSSDSDQDDDTPHSTSFRATDGHGSDSFPTPAFTQKRFSSTSTTSSLERRRSLPARTSMVSLMSTIAPAAPDPDGFQQRRRRAAKLTNFFGVNYRDLFGDVLERFEKGMREEMNEGHMRQAEMEELMSRLRKLKVRRESIVF